MQPGVDHLGTTVDHLGATVDHLGVTVDHLGSGRNRGEYFNRNFDHGYGGYGWRGGFGLGYVDYGAYANYPSQSYYYNPFPVTSTYYPSTTVIYNDTTVERPYSGDLYRNDAAPLSVTPRGTTTGVYGNQFDPPRDDKEGGQVGESQNELGLVDRGNGAFHAGDYEAAARYYVAAVLANDGDEVARLFYGLAQMAMSDYDLAALGMRRALELEPELITRPIDLRSIYPDLATFERHLERLRRYVGAQPEDPNGLFLLGYVYYASVQPENAVSVLRSLTDLDPEDKLAAEIRDAAASVLQRKATEKSKK